MPCAECGAPVEGKRLKQRRVCAGCRGAREQRWAAENRDAVRASQRRHNQTNRVARAAQHRRWRDENREHARELWRAAYARDPAKVIARVTERRSLKRGAGEAAFTAQDWALMQYLFNYRCFYCGTTDERLTQDHLTPLSRGGNHVWDNIVPSCQSCNSRKNALTLSEFIEKETSYA